MLFCVKCQIEYEEGKKFCSNCGSPLTTKEKPFSSHQNMNPMEDEKPDGKPICPHCKIIYEFGSSCLLCGAALVGRSDSQPEDETKLANGPEVDETPFQEMTLQKQQIETPPEKLICPNCKIFYDKMKSCIRCGADLVTHLSSLKKEESKLDTSPEVKQDAPQVQPPQDLWMETSKKKRTCPYCNTVYDEENGCRKCASFSVKHSLSQEKQKPKPFYKPEGIKEDLEAAYSQEVEDEPLQTQTSEKQPLKKITEGIEKRLRLLRRKGKNLQRPSFEAVSIIILMIAAGYFLWSIYSNFIMKQSGPSVPPSGQTAPQAPLSSSTPPYSAATVSEPQEKEKDRSGVDSPISKDVPAAIPPSPLIPISSQAPVSEDRETENIKFLLENIRKANLQKNIDLFMSCYSSDFKGREGKKKSTLEVWGNFSYLDLSYDLKRLSISGKTAKARVEWLIKFSSKASGQPKKSKTVLDVTLKKEEEGWKIKEIRPAG
jgi:predicted amidophosphoribosyltransferase